MKQAADNGTHSGSLPDERGHFGRFGGRFVAETLMAPLDELNTAYRKYLQDPGPFCGAPVAAVFCRALE